MRNVALVYRNVRLITNNFHINKLTIDLLKVEKVSKVEKSFGKT